MLAVPIPASETRSPLRPSCTLSVGLLTAGSMPSAGLAAPLPASVRELLAMNAPAAQTLAAAIAELINSRRSTFPINHALPFCLLAYSNSRKEVSPNRQKFSVERSAIRQLDASVSFYAQT